MDPRDLTPAEIARRFDYHRPSGVAVNMHDRLREEAKLFASNILFGLPAGREKSLAMTAFEECMFWAHAAVARNPGLHEIEGAE